jgi:signal transduction histidine kinase
MTMALVNPLALAINALTLPLAMAFLIIILWYDARKTEHQFLALLLFLIVIGNISFLISQVEILATTERLRTFSISLMQASFSGVSVALYALSATLVDLYSRRFRSLILFGLALVLVFNFFLIVNTTTTEITPPSFFLLFNLSAIFILWTKRQKIANTSILIAGSILSVGQILNTISPETNIATFATSISNIGALLISTSIFSNNIIHPLRKQEEQLEAIQDVNLNVTRRIATNTTLQEITERATQWLDADGGFIFLKKESFLELVALYNMPQSLKGHRLKPEEGITGKTIATQKPTFIENYERDWKGQSQDIPFSKDTIGSLVCVPLTYDKQVIGTLTVITGKQSHVLSASDARKLELLSGQAAVAIAQDTLFTQWKNTANQLNTLLNSADNIIIALDRKLNIIFTNPAANRVVTQVKPFIHLQDLPPSLLPKNPLQVMKTIIKSKQYTYELNINSRNYFCHITQLGETRIEGYLAILNDVTQLKELDRMKSEVVRMMSHDLRNPIQAAMVNIDLLREEIVEAGMNKDTIQYISKIEKQLERMNHITKGILDLEQIRTGSKIRDIYNIRDCIEKAVDEIEEYAKEKEIRIHIQPLSTEEYEFKGDFRQFQRAIVNLLENAIKFTPINGHVFIEIEKYKDIFITIRDTGIGIPEETLPHIFDEFYRGNQPGVEHVSGSGLGLSLVKSVVDNHKGSITVESSVNKGTTFVIKIPSVNTFPVKE